MSLSAITVKKSVVEIWLEILSHVEVKDVKNFRLCSKKHAKIGFGSLYRAFVFRSYNVDLYKLGLYSRKLPREFRRVNRIIFEQGFVDFGNICTFVTKGLDAIIQTHEEMHSDRHVAVEYLIWEHAWRAASQQFNHALSITKAFRLLNNANSIIISHRPPRFRSEELIAAWIQGFSTNYSRAEFLIAELKTIMQAAHDSNMKVRHLAHDLMPAEFFTQEPYRVARVLELFRDLDSLKLTLYTATKSLRPNAVWELWAGIFEALRLAPELKTLHLGFENKKYQDAYFPLRKAVETFTWPSLHRLRLDGLTLCELDLTDFLLGHASSLRSLTLSNIMLAEGSFNGLFHALREGLNLESFHLNGYMICWDNPVERWFFWPAEREIADFIGSDREDHFHDRRFLRLKAEYEKKQHPFARKIDLDGLAYYLQHDLETFVLSKDNTKRWPIDEIPMSSSNRYSRQLINAKWDRHFDRGLGWAPVAHDLIAWELCDLPEVVYWEKHTREIMLKSCHQNFWKVATWLAKESAQDLEVIPLEGETHEMDTSNMKDWSERGFGE